jgi:hypothetical protein
MEGLSLNEKSMLINEFWGRSNYKPSAKELRSEHLLYGYPLFPFYDINDRIVLPDTITQIRFNNFARDPIFGTQIGHIISNFRYSRKKELLVLRTLLKYYSRFKENINIILD